VTVTTSSPAPSSSSFVALPAARRPAQVGLIVSAGFLGLLLVAAIRPQLFASGPNVINIVDTLAGPSAHHPLGADQLGRDIYSRLVYGTRPALLLGVGSVALASLLGAAWGFVAGLGGRVTDEVAMRAADIFLAFPAILMALLVVVVLGPGLRNTAIAIAVAIAPGFARIVRVQTMIVRDSLYVRGSVTLGIRRSTVIFRHVVPNVLSPLLAVAVMSVGTAIVAGSSLSFLGLGVQPPTADWGAMLAEGQIYMQADWTIELFPGLAITLTVIALSMVGRALQGRIEGRERL
jgi:peptide/nickel transport system permease protein